MMTKFSFWGELSGIHKIYFLYIRYDYFDDFLNPFNIRHFELLLCTKCGA